MANSYKPSNFQELLLTECRRRKLSMKIFEGPQSGPPHDPTFTYWVEINGKKCPDVQGKSKKETNTYRVEMNGKKCPDVQGKSKKETNTYWVEINGKKCPDVQGKSKKEHKNLAAKGAYEELTAHGLDSVPESVPLPQPLTSPSLTSDTPASYVSYLNNYSQRKRLLLDFKFGLRHGSAHLPEFSCTCTIGERSFKEAHGSSKREAKALAAKYAFDELNAAEHPSEELPSDIQCSAGNVMLLSNSSKSSNSDSENGSYNYIGRLNEYCSTRGLNYHFEKITQEGPSHKPKFVYCAVVGGHKFEDAVGKNKKAAEQSAAQLALNHLQDSNFSLQECTHLGRYQMSTSKKKGRKEIQLAADFTTKLSTEKNKEDTHSKRFYDEFEDVSRLGQGGYGSVKKARHKVDRKYYAIKSVKLHTGKALQEVFTLADLDHANVVRYYSSWKDTAYFDDETSDSATMASENQGTLCEALFIQMELCAKGTLKDWINDRRGKENEKSQALVIFQQIAEGVKYIHSKQLIHRDLKPSNIFLAEEMKIKIGDFGLVTSSNADGDRTRGVGTATYMSPEQKNHLEKYGWEVDIFALGLIFFEMLRLYPTESEKYREWDDVRKGTFTKDFVGKYPKEVKLLEKMLSEAPEKRPRAADILTSLQEQEPTSAKTY